MIPVKISATIIGELSSYTCKINHPSLGQLIINEIDGRDNLVKLLWAIGKQGNMDIVDEGIARTWSYNKLSDFKKGDIIEIPDLYLEIRAFTSERLELGY